MRERTKKKKRRNLVVRKKSCRMCTEQGLEMNYFNVRLLISFLTDRGKIIPRRVTGTCASHQRVLVTAVKRARQLALVPFQAAKL